MECSEKRCYYQGYWSLFSPLFGSWKLHNSYTHGFSLWMALHAPFQKYIFSKTFIFSYFRFQLYLKMSVKKFILTTIWQRICSVLVTRKAELTRVVETLGDLCYVNPKGVVGLFGVSLVLAKAVVKKAIMAFMPKCRTTSAGFEVHTISVEWNNASKNATINLYSVNSCDHTFFLKKDNYFQILFIQQAKSK